MKGENIERLNKVNYLRIECVQSAMMNIQKDREQQYQKPKQTGTEEFEILMREAMKK